MSAPGLPAWVDLLGWSLVHLLWQGALVGVAFAAMRALVPREQAGQRYAIGLGALGVLAAAPVVTFCSLASSVETISLIAPPAVAGASTAVAAESVAGSIESGVSVLPWLVAAWLCGVALMAARAFGQWRGLERIATQLAWRQADLDDMLARVAERFGGIARVRVLVSRHIDTPTLIGWMRPAILLPAAVALGFPRHQVELILAHELGHLRRYDHLVNLAQAVVETLLFYHPVVHWISREVRHEREVCCDQFVLRLTRGEPREYARTLAALEDLRQLPPQLALAASGGFLLDRVRRILAPAQAPARAGGTRARWL
ncbi:MAG: M56 family metallopeptidase, partial [Xanthomonadales bacterium]|nr:M56 family metallopeptidase [Xanthomonadales bacterium]